MNDFCHGHNNGIAWNWPTYCGLSHRIHQVSFCSIAMAPVLF